MWHSSGLGQHVTTDGDCLVYLTKGKGLANGQTVSDGDLPRTEGLSFEAFEDAQLISVYLMH